MLTLFILLEVLVLLGGPGLFLYLKEKSELKSDLQEKEKEMQSYG
jgi:hypothetical protein